MSDKKIYDYFPDDIENKTAILGRKDDSCDFDNFYKKHMGKVEKTEPADSIGSDNPDDYKMAILDQSGKSKIKKCCNESGQVCHFRQPRRPLSEHPLNTTFNEDAAEVASKGLMLAGSVIVAKGARDALGDKLGPIATGATLVGTGVLIYKLSEQDIKKFYRNYVSRLEGNYDNLISYADYRQFVKKYRFKYEEDYYFLNDVLAGKEDPIDMNRFMELNRFNLANRRQ